jgi:hypothetical protein
MEQKYFTHRQVRDFLGVKQAATYLDGKIEKLGHNKYCLKSVISYYKKKGVLETITDKHLFIKEKKYLFLKNSKINIPHLFDSYKTLSLNGKKLVEEEYLKKYNSLSIKKKFLEADRWRNTEFYNVDGNYWSKKLYTRERAYNLSKTMFNSKGNANCHNLINCNDCYSSSYLKNKTNVSFTHGDSSDLYKEQVQKESVILENKVQNKNNKISIWQKINFLISKITNYGK